jgi:deoxyhypusine monooxygenase
MWERPSFTILVESISDPSNPIGMRMRAAYYLRQAYDSCANENGGMMNEEADEEDNPLMTKTTTTSTSREAVISLLCHQLQNRSHGSLMRHEFAYVLGQLRDGMADASLQSVLLDETDCVMVRHEAAEALGAIGNAVSRPFLQRIIQKGQEAEDIELVDTCRLADNMIAWRMNPTEEEAPVGCACMMNPYSTVDPAPPHPAHEHLSDRELGDMLRDETQHMFDRYRSMFSLRNRRAVPELCHTLITDTSSALLRHEIAYVLGQLQHVDSIPALEESLRRKTEHFMVRHESAESLGAMEEKWETVAAILTEFAADDDIVVRESCLVAIDAADYWGTTTTSSSSNNGDVGVETTTELPSSSSFAIEKAKNNHQLNVEVQ